MRAKEGVSIRSLKPSSKPWSWSDLGVRDREETHERLTVVEEREKSERRNSAAITLNERMN